MSSWKRKKNDGLTITDKFLSCVIHLPLYNDQQNFPTPNIHNLRLGMHRWGVCVEPLLQSTLIIIVIIIIEFSLRFFLIVSPSFSFIFANSLQSLCCLPSFMLSLHPYGQVPGRKSYWTWLNLISEYCLCFQCRANQSQDEWIFLFQQIKWSCSLCFCCCCCFLITRCKKKYEYQLRESALCSLSHCRLCFFLTEKLQTVLEALHKNAIHFEWEHDMEILSWTHWGPLRLNDWSHCFHGSVLPAILNDMSCLFAHLSASGVQLSSW